MKLCVFLVLVCTVITFMECSSPKLKMDFGINLPSMSFNLPSLNLPKMKITAVVNRAKPKRPMKIELPAISLAAKSLEDSWGDDGYGGGGGGGGYDDGWASEQDEGYEEGYEGQGSENKNEGYPENNGGSGGYQAANQEAKHAPNTPNDKPQGPAGPGPYNNPPKQHIVNNNGYNNNNNAGYREVVKPNVDIPKGYVPNVREPMYSGNEPNVNFDNKPRGIIYENKVHFEKPNVPKPPQSYLPIDFKVPVHGGYQVPVGKQISYSVPVNAPNGIVYKQADNLPINGNFNPNGEIIYGRADNAFVKPRNIVNYSARPKNVIYVNENDKFYNRRQGQIKPTINNQRYQVASSAPRALRTSVSQYYG